MNEVSISVAMAAYNGEAYIQEQITSILKQLSASDELVISLDPSTDQTHQIIASFHDSRIKVFCGPGQGVVKNVENAIIRCRNEVIFLSDQDDIWLPNKKEAVLQSFTSDVCVVLHDAQVVDSNLNEVYPSFFEHRRCKLGMVRNLIKNSYIGCCIAFRKELRPYILPFPDRLPMHDQWIGLVGEKIGRNRLLKEPLILYRRHEDNASRMEHASLQQMVLWRFNVLKAIMKVRK